MTFSGLFAITILLSVLYVPNLRGADFGEQHIQTDCYLYSALL